MKMSSAWVLSVARQQTQIPASSNWSKISDFCRNSIRLCFRGCTEKLKHFVAEIEVREVFQKLEKLLSFFVDLQFQMVFPKGGVTVLQTSPTTSSSSPEDEHKLVISPGQVNITPLQIELLERDLADLKTNFSESRTRNVYLQSVVDEQKKTIEALKSGEEEMVATGKAVHLKEHRGKPAELEEKLEEADRMIRRLRRENEEQRKEVIGLDKFPLCLPGVAAKFSDMLLIFL